MVIALEFDVRNGQEVASLITKLKGKATRAVVGAFNDVGKKGRTELARGVTKHIKAKYGDVLKSVNLTKATPANLGIRLSMREKYRPGLMNYGAKETKKGVTYRIAKSGKRGFIAGAFIARGRPGRGTSGKVFKGPATGAQRVFKRVGKARLPLLDLKGPSLNAVIRTRDTDEAIAKTIESQLPERILARLRLAEQRSS